MTILSLSGFTKLGIIQDIVGIEGGATETNDPTDHGGDTKFGITQVEANTHLTDLKNLYQWDGIMGDLTLDMAMWIYSTFYWAPLNLDNIIQVAPLLAHKLFDIGVNLGPGVAGKWLQQALNVFSKNQSLYNNLVIDGGIGNVTLAALNTYLNSRNLTNATWHLLVAIGGQQINRYITIAINDTTQERFEDGWEDRIGNELADYASVLNILNN